MSVKFKLPKHIEMRDAMYTLAYVPGDETSIEPNFGAMQPTAADCSVVTFGNQKKWMSWVMMDAPARAGTTIPPRKFLLFRLYDQPIQPMPAMFPDMIAYMCTPVEQGLSPAQQFLNALAGKCEEEQVAAVPRDDWAQKLFVVEDDAEVTSPEKEAEKPIQRHSGPMPRPAPVKEGEE